MEGDFVRIIVSLCVSPGFKLSLHTSFSFWIPALPGLWEVHCTAPSCMGTTMNINRWAPQGITARTCLAAGWECQYLHNTGIVISPVFVDFSPAIWFILTPRYTFVRVKDVKHLGCETFRTHGTTGRELSAVLQQHRISPCVIVCYHRLQI